MASIQKRGKKYAVVYTYTDSADVKRQKWETYGTKKEAAARKAQVENEMNNGTFIPPSSVTVRDFLADFVELYGSKRWGLSAYSGNTGIINNYINPVIGDMNVQDVTRRTVDSFIAQLQKMKPVSTTYRNARSEFLPPNTIEKVCKVLHCAFRQAVRWDMVPKNPFDDVLLPKKEKNPRAIWTADINLVVALPNGRPCEETVISNAFRRLKRDAQLPDVVFHSLRHSSTTYKLKLNHGDIKAAQGDTGHSQADMVTKVYAHILDEDRKVNAQKFESAFYANPDLRGVQAPAEPAPALDVQSIILQLQQSPELLSALTSLISNQGCK